MINQFLNIMHKPKNKFYLKIMIIIEFLNISIDFLASYLLIFFIEKHPSLNDVFKLVVNDLKFLNIY